MPGLGIPDPGSHMALNGPEGLNELYPACNIIPLSLATGPPTVGDHFVTNSGLGMVAHAFKPTA